MAGEIQSFSFKSIVCMLDNNEATGFFEGDDAIMIERNTDTATPMIGADGTSTVSISADDSAMITLKLQPGSPTNKYLENKHKRQRNGTLQPFAVTVRDTSNGEGGSAAQCVIVKRPSRSFGQNATVREWKLFAGAWQDRTQEFLPA
ncbi:MAG: DUF3277 family protein [Nitratireductor sp.]|nr:DUF3277 family protein [Nitratireductor sp.]